MVACNDDVMITSFDTFWLSGSRKLRLQSVWTCASHVCWLVMESYDMCVATHGWVSLESRVTLLFKHRGHQYVITTNKQSHTHTVSYMHMHTHTMMKTFTRWELQFPLRRGQTKRRRSRAGGRQKWKTRDTVKRGTNTMISRESGGGPRGMEFLHHYGH